VKYMDKYGVIYKITNKINGKVYIGQTTGSFDRRYSSNLERNTSSEHLRSSIRKYGIENFEIEKELFVAKTKEELDELERRLIRQYNSNDPAFGYNSSDGGANGKPNEETKRRLSESHKGYVMPEEQKKAISKSLKGKSKPPFSEEHKANISKAGRNRKPISEETRARLSKASKGRKMSAEARRKISESLTGRPSPLKGIAKSEEHRKNISRGRKGIVFSDEHKKHLSEARKGRTLSEEHKRKIGESSKGRKQSEETIEKRMKNIRTPVICLTTNEVFGSIAEAAEAFGIKRAVICNCCKGKQKTAGKKEWAYFND